jgi:hypothetical protein
MRRNAAKTIALGGVMAALAVVIMSMGGMIPLATYVSPVLCMLILNFVYRLCGARIGWAWYGAVAVLSLLLSADKEAAAVFAFLGYYPVVKPRLDALKFSLLWKLLLFNGITVVMYWLLMTVFGMDAIAEEFRAMGSVMLLITLLLGNVTFLLTDRILGGKIKKKNRGGT